jgi:hypothetical protein
MSCNATDRCCSGTVQTHPLNCQEDNLGIPRCTVAVDHDCKMSGAVPAGTACASSADCCGIPCVPNPAGMPPFVCGSAQCVPSGGSCTTTADCCRGSTCAMGGDYAGTCVTNTTVPTGAGGAGGTGGAGGSGGAAGTGGASGTAGSGGTGGMAGTSGSCAAYGQMCATMADCCNGLPCSSVGKCGYIIP